MLPGSNTPLSISLADHLTPEEREQLLQSIEMFETVVQATPDDYATLQILKEAYWKIGRLADARATGRRLADLYMELEQPLAALTEYKALLEQDPNGEDPASNGVYELIAELEQTVRGKPASPPPASISLDFGSVEGVGTPPADVPKEQHPGKFDELGLEVAGGSGAPGIDLPIGFYQPDDGVEAHTLIATPATVMPGTTAPKPVATDGLEALAKFLLQHQLASQEVVDAALNEVRLLAATAGVRQGLSPAPSLLNEMQKAGVDLEPLMAGIVDRTKFAYIPLEYYDIDRHIVKMLPESVTLGHLVVPFDMVGRTLMVAIDNPFDATAKNAVQQSAEYHIQWHLALPQVIQRILREVYRLHPE